MDQIPDGTFLYKNQNKRVNIFHLYSLKDTDIFTMILKPKTVK